MNNSPKVDVKRPNKRTDLEGKKFLPKCPECGNHRLILDKTTDDQICRVCGAVVGDRLIDKGPEWRAFSSEELQKRSRVGSPMSVTIHDKGLSTIIGWENRDIYGQQLSLTNRKEMYRLRKWQHRLRIHSSSERNLVKAFHELDRLSSHKIH